MALTTSFASRSTASLSLRWRCSYLVLDKIQDNLHPWPVRFRKLAVRVAGSRSLGVVNNFQQAQNTPTFSTGL